MISAQKIKFLRSLHLRKFREKEQLFLVEGEKCVAETLQSNFRIVEIFAVPEWSSPHPIGDTPLNRISPAVLERISTFKTPNQVVALVEIPSQSPPLETPWILALDGIRDPGNLGSILRSADWFGFSQVICSPDTAELFNPKVIQASMGSFTRVRVHYIHLPNYLQENGKDKPIWGAVLQGISSANLAWTASGILVVGSESHGISEEVMNCIQHPVSIPKVHSSRKTPESLNAASAAAILMYCIQSFQANL